MQLGFVGLGRMGLNMTLRLVRGGHRVVGYAIDPAAVAEAARQGAVGVNSLEALVAELQPPRVVWLMIPAGKPVDDTIEHLVSLLWQGDVIVDGGNSNYKDSIRRAERLAPAGIEYVDCGTSGGVWGLDNGYCMMLGGNPAALAHLKPALDTLAPPDGWRHVGVHGAGHFVKMVHNGIEYGLMQAYAEGFELMNASRFDLDLADIAGLWGRGSVVRSWLLELAERAFQRDPKMETLKGWVDDSGEGRWTVQEAIDLSVPAEVITLSLLTRFRSRQADSFRDRVLAALRNEFGGHAVKGT